jgi:mono/diheme cytochrome c family protein
MNKFLIGGTGVAILALGVLWWTVSEAPAESINTADAAFVEQGRLLYARECAVCHGKNLEGQIPNWRSRLPDGSIPAPPHDETGHTWHHPDAQLFEVTKLGRKGVSGGTVESNMPAFADKLSDREIWAVLSFIKSRWPERVARRHDMINRHMDQQRMQMR